MATSKRQQNKKLALAIALLPPEFATKLEDIKNETAQKKRVAARKCKIPGCKEPHHNQGYCKKHWQEYLLDRNAKRVGQVFTDTKGYTHIYLEDGKSIPLHRKIWEEAHGPIPPFASILFKDGDRSNISLDNLVMSIKPGAVGLLEIRCPNCGHPVFGGNNGSTLP